MPRILEVNGLRAGYGMFSVLHDVSFRVDEGEMVALIGSNGAGKTTALRCVCGLIPSKSGSIAFRGQEYRSPVTHELVEAGLVCVPEGRELFPGLSVRDALLVGGANKRARGSRQKNLQRVYDLFPKLRDRQSQLCSTLSGGEQQMVAIGRALMALPSLLLLDEPSLGLAPTIVKQLFETISLIREQGVSILLVEQNVRTVLRIADRAYVMENGSIEMEGSAEALANDPRVVDAYFGVGSKENVWWWLFLLMPADIHKSRKSKHSLITEAISAQIEGGKYRTGDLLPSESELGKAFGVSRHTVRAALRNLATLGLVASHQGVGTHVQAEKVTSRYNFAFNSVPDLHQYAAQTVVHLLDIKEIVTDAQLAEYLGCKKSEHWWRIRTMRSERIGGTIGAYSEIFVPSAFGAAIPQIRKNTSRTVFSHLEEYLNETVAEIRQEIAAVSLTAEEAARLQVKRSSPALEITRRYLRKNQDVFEIARAVHPASLFKYSMQIRLQHS